MEQFIIIKTNKPEKIKLFLDQEKQNYRVFNQVKRRKDLFANYEEATKDKEREKEKRFFKQKTKREEKKTKKKKRTKEVQKTKPKRNTTKKRRIGSDMIIRKGEVYKFRISPKETEGTEQQ